MITPGDISDELIEKAEAECDYNTGEWDCADPKEIAAAILNAAIEAGVVSPACYCGRKAFGSVAVGPIIEHEGIPILWAPGANPQNVITEHWKGQTE